MSRRASPRRGFAKRPSARLPAGYDAWTELPLIAVLVLGPWLAAQDVDVAGGRLDAALGLAWMLGGALLVLGFRESPCLLPPFAIAVCAWGALTLLSVATTTDLGYSAVHGARTVGAMACLFLPLIAAGANAEARTQRLYGAVVAGAAIASMEGITQWLRNVYVLGAPDWRTFGTFSSPNALAGYAALAAPLAGGLALAQRERAWRWLAWFLAGLIVAVVPLTGSRTGLGALVVAAGVLAMVALPGSAPKRALAVTGILVALAAALIAVPPVRARALAVFSSQGYSFAFRLHCFEAAARAVVDRPLLGWGVGTYRIAHLAKADVDFTTNAHNDVLQTATECGIPAAMAAVAAFGIALASAARGARPTTAGPRRSGRSPDNEPSVSGGLRQGALAGLVGLLVHGLLECDWVVRPTLCAAMAVLAGLAILSSTSAYGADEPRGRPRLSAGLAAIAIGAVVTLVAWQSSAAFDLSRRATDLARAGYAHTAMQLYKKADALFPLDKAALRKRVLLGDLGAAEVEAAFEPILGRNPWRTEHYRAKADCLARLGRYDLAEPVYAKALELAPLLSFARIGLAACAQSRGDDRAAIEHLEQLAALEHAPYGRYQPVPERASLEFVYPAAALAELRPDDARLEDGIARARAYVQTYERVLSRATARYEGSRQLVALTLANQGLSPAGEKQARVMLARLLWMKAERAGDEQEAEGLRREANEADSYAVRRMDGGEWRGILVETMTYRAEGGL